MPSRNRSIKAKTSYFNRVNPEGNHFTPTSLQASPLDDFLGNIFGKEVSNDNKEEGVKSGNDIKPIIDASDNDEKEETMSISSFQQELAKRDDEDEDDEFCGYDLRDFIYDKWGECFDVEFQRVESYGVKSVYLNIMPFRLGGKTFRHETEMDYLCHLQAVVEILVKYNQLDFAIAQLVSTDKKPRAGTSPLIAVPLRLNLTPEQVEKILG